MLQTKMKKEVKIIVLTIKVLKRSTVNDECDLR